MNGVKEEEDLCFCMLLLDWLCGQVKEEIQTVDVTFMKYNIKDMNVKN